MFICTMYFVWIYKGCVYLCNVSNVLFSYNYMFVGFYAISCFVAYIRTWLRKTRRARFELTVDDGFMPVPASRWKNRSRPLADAPHETTSYRSTRFLVLLASRVSSRGFRRPHTEPRVPISSDVTSGFKSSAFDRQLLLTDLSLLTSRNIYSVWYLVWFYFLNFMVSFLI